jgi:hypothetical protein
MPILKNTLSGDAHNGPVPVRLCVKTNGALRVAPCHETGRVLVALAVSPETAVAMHEEAALDLALRLIGAVAPLRKVQEEFARAADGETWNRGGRS